MLNPGYSAPRLHAHAVLAGSLPAGCGRPRRVAGDGAGGDRRRRLCRSVGSAGARQARHRCGGARSRPSSALAPAPGNGGAVSGGVNVGKGFTGRAHYIAPTGRASPSDAAEAFDLVDRLIGEEAIDCFWEKPGRFVGAGRNGHFEAQSGGASRCSTWSAWFGADMVPRRDQRQEIASDYYHGGMVVERSGKLHPALDHEGLLDACRAARRQVCAKAGSAVSPASTMPGGSSGTSRGEVTAGDSRYRHQRLPPAI